MLIVLFVLLVYFLKDKHKGGTTHRFQFNNAKSMEDTKAVLSSQCFAAVAPKRWVVIKLGKLTIL